MGIKTPATDQLLLDGLLAGALHDHASKLKIAVKCGDHSGVDCQFISAVYGHRKKPPVERKDFQCMNIPKAWLWV